MASKASVSGSVPLDSRHHGTEGPAKKACQGVHRDAFADHSDSLLGDVDLSWLLPISVHANSLASPSAARQGHRTLNGWVLHQPAAAPAKGDLAFADPHLMGTHVPGHPVHCLVKPESGRCTVKEVVHSEHLHRASCLVRWAGCRPTLGPRGASWKGQRSYRRGTGGSDSGVLMP